MTTNNYCYASIKEPAAFIEQHYYSAIEKIANFICREGFEIIEGSTIVAIFRIVSKKTKE